MDDKTLITIVAIGSVTALEIAALFAGIDGALFMAGLTLVGGLAGYQLKRVISKPP